MKMFFVIQLYTLQICAASLSLLSSSFIAVGILRSESGLNNPYRRIVFGISASDILHSLSIIAGPFAVPETTPTAQWAIGNHSSCRAIGFLFQLSSICTPLYMLGLCLYTVFKVTKNVSNQKFTRQIEKKMHRRKFKVGGSWRMDETYIKVKGVWKYLYRAVDKDGSTTFF